VFVQLPGLAFAIAGPWHRTRTPPDPLTVLVVCSGIAAAALLLVPSRRFAVIAVAALALPSIALAPGPPVAALPVAFAVGRAIVAGDSVWAWSTLAGMGSAGVVWILVRARADGGIRLLAATVVLCVVAAAVTGASTRRERFRAAAREESSRRRSAAEEERLRIARELHDVIAHSLSQISVQAGVGLHLFDDDPESARRSLRSIRDTSATALEEVRGVLGMLRRSDEPGAESAVPRRPEPNLAAIPALLEETRQLGLEIVASGDIATGTGTGGRAISAATQTAAYRIVQESLTNVRRHAASSTVDVEVAASDDAIDIRIENAAAASAHGGAGRGLADRAELDSELESATRVPGRGILGMRERAAALGGRLEAAPTPNGGFRVVARLPLTPSAAAGRGWT
jgi:signal transduction histidine kinase